MAKAQTKVRSTKTKRQKTSSRKTVPAPKSATNEAEDTGTNSVQSTIETPSFKKVDLISAVTNSTHLKRSDAKVAVEATLAALGAALAEGKDLNVAPLGKIRQIKAKDLPSGAKVHTLKLRRKTTSKLDG